MTVRDVFSQELVRRGLMTDTGAVLGIRTNETTGLPELDDVGRQVVGASSGVSKSLSHYMRNTADFCYGMRAAVDDMVDFAASNQGRTLSVEIPAIDASFDGTTIEIPPFAKFIGKGGVTLNPNGFGVPVFWIRPDKPGFLPTQPTVGAFSAGAVLDFSSGTFVLENANGLAGLVMLRHGAADGVMGGAIVDVSPATPYSILYEIRGMTAIGCDHAIEFTNLHTFSIRHRNIRTDGVNKGVVTSSAVGADYGEMGVFEKCFFGNTIQTQVELNSAYELTFEGGSLTLCRGGNIDINANNAKVFLTGGQRIEGGSYVSKSSGTYPRSVVALSDMIIMPTAKPDGINTQPAHMRKLFQGNHQVSISTNTMLDMAGACPFDTTYAAASNYWMADTTTVVRGRFGIVTQDLNATLRAIPLTSRQSLLPNASFSSGVAGWSRGVSGTIAHVAGDGATANGCMSVAITAGQAFAYSPLARGTVAAGRWYGADACIKLLASPTPTANFYINIRINWYGDAVASTLANNPLTTGTAGTGVVYVSMSNHGMSTGDMLTLSGASAVDGITAPQLTGSFPVTYVNANAVTITTTGTATAGAVAGGGAAVVATPPATYLSSSAYIPQGWLAATAPTVYGAWLRHGGTGIVEAPAGATSARVELATNTAHTGTLYVDDVMLTEYA